LGKYTFSQRTKSRSIVPLLAALWAAVVALYLFLAATYERSVVVFGADLSPFEVLRNEAIDYASAVAVAGPGVFGLVAPVLLALAPLAIRKYRRGALLIAGALTLGVCLLWPLSIGVLYMPTALLLLFTGARMNAGSAHAI